MPIRLDLNDDNEWHVIFYAIVILGSGLVLFECMLILDESQRSVIMVRMPNVTRIEIDAYYNISYDDCRCSVTPTANCLSNRQFRLIHVLPLLLFVLQVRLVREILPINGNHKYLLRNAYWTVSLLMFFAILTLIYHSTYYYEFTAKVLLCTGAALFSLVACYGMRDSN